MTTRSERDHRKVAATCGDVGVLLMGLGGRRWWRTSSEITERGGGEAAKAEVGRRHGEKMNRLRRREGGLLRLGFFGFCGDEEEDDEQLRIWNFFLPKRDLGLGIFF